MSPPDPIRRRRPGGGRKPAPYSPVMAVSVSMSMDERNRIDRAALAAGRTRSAFILNAVYHEIERNWPDLLVASPVDVPINRRDAYEDARASSALISREQRDQMLPITVAERERRLDEGEHPDVVWAAFGDPTRGGKWNPAMFGSVIDCVACPARIPSAALYCFSCGVEQPAAFGPEGVE